MGTHKATGLTYDDLLRMPETNRFVELLDGELVVSPSPELEHQVAVTHVATRFELFSRQHGGHAIIGPMDVVVNPGTVVQPDVLLIVAGRVPEGLARPIAFPPDVAVEVLSPSNRAHDLVRKRAIYERFGVAELWFVDLRDERVEVVGQVGGGGFGPAAFFGPGEVVRSVAVAGLEVDVDGILGGR